MGSIAPITSKEIDPTGDYKQKYGFFDAEKYVFKAKRGLSEEVVREISFMKSEPEWMTQRRLKALKIFRKKPMPNWGADLSVIDFENIFYYLKATDKQSKTWEDLPAEIKETYDKLGVPEAERKFLAGVSAQYECLAKGTLVWTEKGGKAIESLTIKDKVWAYDEEKRRVDLHRVLGIKAKGVQDVYKVETTSRTLECTANHPFLYTHRTREGKLEWRYLSDLKVGDYVVTARKHPEEALLRPAATSGLPAELGTEKIRKVEWGGLSQTYDIAVEGVHNFIANGIVVHNSEVVYHSLQKELSDKGVIFCDTDTALREHEDLVKEYFGTLIPAADNKFAALNTAVWSGGSFLYIPKGVHVEVPLQAYFRINAENMGQFERTLIICDEGSSATYIEGCTAPIYTTDSLHSAVVEIIVKKGAHCRYTTIQNWSTNVFNLVTKRAAVYQDGFMEWVDSNLGCIARGSTLTTPEGIKPIEKIEVGDRVLAFDEPSGELAFRAVTAKRFSGMQPVHTVAIGERKLQVTANHPFYSYKYDGEAPKKLGRYQLGYVRADRLQKAIVPRTSIDYGRPYTLRVPNLVTEFKSGNQYAPELTMVRTRATRMTQAEETHDDLMWLFGYWVGDGDIAVKAGKTEGMVRWATVGFSTPREDRARRHLVGAMTALVEAVPTERADGYHLSWSSKELAEFFAINGFTGNARTKRVPQWVWSLPESQRLAFVAGYLDADGCVLGGRLQLKSANKHLLEDIASLLVTLGITSRLQTEFDEPKQVMIMGIAVTAHGSHMLNFRGDERILRYTSPTLRDKAFAHQRFHRTGRAVGRSNINLPETMEIVKVSVSPASDELASTWDIEVEGTGNFVSQGFVVHNSQITMKYPSCYLMEPGAKGDVLSVAFAGKGQHQDAGGKMIHVASNTTGTITSKSISKGGGRTSYRGHVKIYPGANNCKSFVKCDALLLDENSRSDTYPYIDVEAENVTLGHEATVSRISDEQLFYLMSRGIRRAEAETMIINGFIEPLTKELPLEYAVEMNRLIQLEMTGSVG